MDKQGAAALWEKASQLIKSEINSVSYDYWFQDLQPADWDGEKLTLMADNDFGRNLLKEKYDELIRTALQRAAGRPVSYVILTPAEAKGDPTCHGEMEAIRAACRAGQGFRQHAQSQIHLLYLCDRQIQ